MKDDDYWDTWKASEPAAFATNDIHTQCDWTATNLASSCCNEIELDDTLFYASLEFVLHGIEGTVLDHGLGGAFMEFGKCYEEKFDC